MPNRYNALTLCWSASNLPNNKLYWCCLSNVTVSSFGQDITRRILRFFVPLMSTLMSTWCHACDSFSQAFPLRSCKLQVIKNWRQEWPGNEAKVSGCLSLQDNSFTVMPYIPIFQASVAINTNLNSFSSRTWICYRPCLFRHIWNCRVSSELYTTHHHVTIRT